MKVNSYKELVVWQKGIELVSCVYLIADQLPKFEVYILVSQILRAAISIPSNIAEGYRRNGRPEFIHFLSIAIGSASELETQLIIIQKQYSKIDCKKAFLLLEEIQKILYVLIKKLKTKPE